jgi:hypothetical protein
LLAREPFALNSIIKPYNVKTADYSSTVPVDTAATAASTVTQSQLFVLPSSSHFETSNLYRGSEGECRLKYLLDVRNFVVDKTA